MHIYLCYIHIAISNDEKKTIKSFQVGMTGTGAGTQQSSYEVANRLWDMIAEDVV